MADMDRRASLALGGVLLPALLIGGCKSSGEVDKKAAAGGGEQEVTANEDLMREHGILRRILVVYREAAPKIAAASFCACSAGPSWVRRSPSSRIELSRSSRKTASPRCSTKMRPIGLLL